MALAAENQSDNKMQQRENQARENLSSKLKGLARYRRHIRDESDACKIIGFLYAHKEATAREIAEGTGVLDTPRDLWRLKEANLVVQDNGKYSLTDEGIWTVLCKRLGLTFLQLRILAFAYSECETFKRIGSRPVFIVTVYLSFSGRYKPKTVRMAASKLVEKGYLKRMGKDRLTEGVKYGELVLYAQDLDRLYRWIMAKNNEEAKVIENDPETKINLEILQKIHFGF